MLVNDGGVAVAAAGRAETGRSEATFLAAEMHAHALFPGNYISGHASSSSSGKRVSVSDPGLVGHTHLCQSPGRTKRTRTSLIVITQPSGGYRRHRSCGTAALSFTVSPTSNSATRHPQPPFYAG